MMLLKRFNPGQLIRPVMILGFLLLGVGAPLVEASDPKEMLKLLDEMDSSYSRVNDYVGVLHNRERVGRKLDDGELHS